MQRQRQASEEGSVQADLGHEDTPGRPITWCPIRLILFLRFYFIVLYFIFFYFMLIYLF